MRILKKIWWLPFAVYLVVMPAFITDIAYDTSCKKIEIDISDSLDYSFVTSEGIFSLIHNDGEKILGKLISEIKVKEIESRIRTIRELEKVEVYSTVDGVLHVEADQRDPLLRIMTTYGNSFYVDKHGVIIPYSDSYTPRLLVVSGNIDIPDEYISRGEINSAPDDELIKQVYKMAIFLNGDEFWSAQVEQVWVNNRNEFELVPRAGRHIIKFGGQNDMENKFRDIKAFYLEILPVIGWDKYREINLRYKGQIVCKKR